MREAAELAWQRPSGLGVGGGHVLQRGLLLHGAPATREWGRGAKGDTGYLLTLKRGRGTRVLTPKPEAKQTEVRTPWQGLATRSLNTRAQVVKVAGLTRAVLKAHSSAIPWHPEGMSEGTVPSCLPLGDHRHPTKPWLSCLG